MVIHLSEKREQIVRSFVQNGGFLSEDEVIGEALRLLEERDEQAKLAELRREIAISIEQANRGELVPFDPHATLQRIRSRLASSAGPS
jgi:putative addiction module CopG family antidote